jgi:hypothetical protein
LLTILQAQTSGWTETAQRHCVTWGVYRQVTQEAYGWNFKMRCRRKCDSFAQKPTTGSGRKKHTLCNKNQPLEIFWVPNRKWLRVQLTS